MKGRSYFTFGVSSTKLPALAGMSDVQAVATAAIAMLAPDPVLVAGKCWLFQKK